MSVAAVGIHFAVSALLVAGASARAAQASGLHVLRVTTPILEPEDGLLLGNGDLSVSVYQTRDRVIFRLGKGDVWDRRIDRSDDPAPPHIKEIAHGIAVEGWKCPPYGDAEPVALRGTKDPARMKELCRGAPASYVKRPYPCPKPVGEFSVQLPPDVPGLSIGYELAIEEVALRVTCAGQNGVEIRLVCYVPPRHNALVVEWELRNWDAARRIGNRPPLRFALYRWPDPDSREFGERYAAESGHGAFLGIDHVKAKPLEPPAVKDIAGRRSIEQQFPADPTFPQGFRYLLAPFVAEGAIEPVAGSATREARLTIEPPRSAANGSVAILVATTSDPGGAEAELERIAAALAATKHAESIAAWGREARDAARSFWAASSVSIEDPLLENLWYETHHARRSTTKAGKTPPGLFLPSTVRDFSHWHGDYHTNYNFQQPFWGDYVANHIEAGDAYCTGMAYLFQMGKIIAERYYGTRGAFIQLSGYPILATDDVLGAVPMGRMAYMTGWAAGPYWSRYLLTLDVDWLKTVGYPAIKECALFYLDFMKKGEDGLYHIFPSNQGEDGFTGDPKDYTDRAQVMRHARHCLRCAVRASEVLALDADLRSAWLDRLEHAAGDDGRPPEKLSGIEKHFRDANPPEFGDGRPYKPPARSAAPAPWPGPEQWTDLWYAGQYILMALPALRSGNLEPEGAYLGLRRIIERWRHPNGLIWAMSVADYGHAGAWTETLGMCAPLQEMMLQSFGGVIRIFPCWPSRVGASYRTFRAEGAFLVSATWKDGSVRGAEIQSERGGTCRLYSPWPEGLRVEAARGGEAPATIDEWGIFTFATVAGETYRLVKR